MDFAVWLIFVPCLAGMLVCGAISFYEMFFEPREDNYPNVRHDL
jgi:hypothetical protein